MVTVVIDDYVLSWILRWQIARLMLVALNDDKDKFDKRIDGMRETDLKDDERRCGVTDDVGAVDQVENGLRAYQRVTSRRYS